MPTDGSPSVKSSVIVAFLVNIFQLYVKSVIVAFALNIFQFSVKLVIVHFRRYGRR
jgi:hypothetical protein